MADVPETVMRFHLYMFFNLIFPEQTSLVGILSGLVTAIATQPLDVLQSKLSCDMTFKKLDYKNINYFRGTLLSIIINSMQAAIFYKVYHIIPKNLLLM